MKLTTRETYQAHNGQLLKKLQEKIVNDFLDLIILAKLQEKPQTVYGLFIYIRKRFGVYICNGTSYSLMATLESKGLVKGEWRDNKHFFSLTPEGQATVDALISLKQEVLMFTGLVFGEEEAKI